MVNPLPTGRHGEPSANHHHGDGLQLFAVGALQTGQQTQARHGEGSEGSQSGEGMGRCIHNQGKP